MQSDRTGEGGSQVTRPCRGETLSRVNSECPGVSGRDVESQALQGDGERSGLWVSMEGVRVSEACLSAAGELALTEVS